MKTGKGFLKTCLAIAETDRDELKGIEKLTHEEYLILGNIRAGVQNDLGQNAELLEKFNLQYEG